MSGQLQHELKKEFQLERLILFSDAVFAIAITLLVIEIKVPAIDQNEATDALLLQALDSLIPKFIGFFVSFFIIGLYWTIHHRMFGFVINYTRRTLWLNLIFLLAVVLMPFSTAFYSEYIIHLLKLPVIVYVANIVFLGIMNFALWNHIMNPKLNLAQGITKEEKKYFSYRALVVPFIFIITACIYLFVNPGVAIWLPMIIPVFMRIFKIIYFRKNAIRS